MIWFWYFVVLQNLLEKKRSFYVKKIEQKLIQDLEIFNHQSTFLMHVKLSSDIQTALLPGYPILTK